MSIRILPIGEDDDPVLSPDLVLTGDPLGEQLGDLAIAAADETGNRGGLRSRQMLATAVFLCLCTDVAADPSELRDGDENRGWPGDGFRVGPSPQEGPLGSKLWLLRRRTVDDQAVPRLAEEYAQEALRPLVDQGAVARFDVVATAQPTRSRLDIAVTGLDAVGGVVFDQRRYAVLWDQLNRTDRPLEI